jgi:hypothetical protein
MSMGAVVGATMDGEGSACVSVCCMAQLLRKTVETTNNNSKVKIAVAACFTIFTSRPGNIIAIHRSISKGSIKHRRSRVFQ